MVTAQYVYSQNSSEMIFAFFLILSLTYTSYSSEAEQLHRTVVHVSDESPHYAECRTRYFAKCSRLPIENLDNFSVFRFLPYKSDIEQLRSSPKPFQMM